MTPIGQSTDQVDNRPPPPPHTLSNSSHIQPRYFTFAHKSHDKIDQVQVFNPKAGKRTKSVNRDLLANSAYSACITS